MKREELKQVGRVNQARRLAPYPLLLRQDKRIKQIALAEIIAEDSETNQSKSGNQALSPFSSHPLSQFIHP